MGRAVHQFVPRLAWGDAVGNQVRYLRALLRSWGFDSEIFADQTDEASATEARPAEQYPRQAGKDALLLIHHSFQSRLVPLLRRAPGRKALIYHNVTPASLFEGFERKTAAACVAAREELLELRPLVQAAFAYSRFSAEELAAAGYPPPRVLPFAVDWSAFDVAPDPVLRAQLDDGCRNVLFVGRGVPSKRLDDVLRVFTAYQQLHAPRSRLLIAGELNRDSAYGLYVHGQRELLGAEQVQFLGRVSAAQLSALYSAAHVYLSMSRHEGFGVPLLEAMYRGVPVVAYGAAAVPETMAGSGLVSLTRDPLAVARLLAVLDHAPDLRERVVSGQKARLAALGQDAVAAQVREALEDVLESRDAPTPSPESWDVDVVHPTLELAPEAPSARTARALASALRGQARVRLLTLKASGWPERPAPERAAVEGDVPLFRFSPEQPLEREGGAPPRSSSLEAALRVSPARVTLLFDCEPEAASWGPVFERPGCVRVGADTPAPFSLVPTEDIEARARSMARGVLSRLPKAGPSRAS
ncbi:glycosyltransferase family 4 protein [Archangium minus]|uniref:glycosyltransferase family 4 protein n=1 Tax=Archangium minus TaxID=83450 RepID=UPI0037BFFD15